MNKVSTAFAFLITAAVLAPTVLTLAPVAQAATSIQVKADEFSFRLSTKTLAKPGTVAFVVKNIGHVGHNFKIDGKKIPPLQPGKTAKLTVRFAKKGRYPYLCTVSGHVTAGMKGVFTVG
jgi:uncharacterized cupredoxin-like copper-binding protein